MHQHPKHPIRVLFVGKRRPISYGASYGLKNSCVFLCNALESMGVEAKLVEVIDNNCIDREVHQFKPTHVFIEALWVVPEKFDVLLPLHKKVKWHVRLHSNTPFLSNEGIAMKWLVAYNDLSKKYDNFTVTPNSERMIDDLYQSLGMKTYYAPNIYQPDDRPFNPANKDSNIINIGCFGAIRPLKNHLIQAMAAMTFANEAGKTLHFHVNSSRLEQKGENVYKNLVSLFSESKHKLVTHEWLQHHEFLQLINDMDIGVQVSFSETFNIVAADFAHQNVPIVGSEEIEWMHPLYQAKPTDLENIVSHLWLAWIGRKVSLHSLNKWGLNRYNEKARKVWAKYLGI